MKVLAGSGTAVSGPLLRKLQGFGKLEEADTAALAIVEAGTRLIPAGTDLICEGDRPEGMIAVTEGFACRYKLRANGARQIAAYLIPGDICDFDTSVLNRIDHTIGTLSGCRVARIGPEAGRELRQRPALARSLRKVALVEEATLREWLMNIGRRSAVERLAHLLCELLVRLRAVGLASGNSFDLPITQIDLADTTGMTSVHVNRSLGELKRAGLIERKGKRVTLCDLPRLVELAEFRSNYLNWETRTAA
ncbi:Crp/Fnr family transcriptional regulator [Methylobacterium sp. AMS5]|uniref:Crp/Fnr family transcriptional regulator n=1 Tax=Methylobacterium sp. AMS5 TaxID=925818 RepID=UPI00074F9F36|nr:Crp/Fnr family transcriptional regulator [Methylobacterium sp. AMS5]AMB46714.1 cyclic nucleotide-binding protein [Methylobacterium sp. AMS5]